MGNNRSIHSSRFLSSVLNRSYAVACEPLFATITRSRKFVKRSNRLVNPDGKGNVPISEVEIPPQGRVVHLRGFGFVKVFRTVSQDGERNTAGDDGREEGRGGEAGMGHGQGWVGLRRS